MHGRRTTKAFELLKALGDRVWLARDTALDRTVVLKFQRLPDCEASRAALLAEADTLARCDHPSIVQFHRTVPASPENEAFYSMKALGPSLAEKLRAGALADSDVRKVGRAIASALAQLHALSPPMAHGNVSRDSILFDSAGAAYLAGFGKAAPAGATGAADDVRDLGEVLRSAMPGRPPRSLRAILDRMLAPDPAARPSASEVASALAGRARSGVRHAAFAIAGVAAFIAAIMAAASLPGRLASDPVIDEVSIPTHTAAAATLAPRLPPLAPDSVRRIPWQAALSGRDNSIANNRLLRGIASPDNTSRLCVGATRIIRLPGGPQIEMVAVPRGYYRHGWFSGRGGKSEAETPITAVQRDFWMARTELTREQFAAVMRTAPAVAGHHARRLRPWEGRGGHALEIEGGDLPVGEDLDLADVMRFIDALNALCGLEGERRFRLPAEAEWELACRAFVARPFEGEKNPEEAAWTAGNSGGVAHPVARKAQNPLGLFDMHGNLAEWCADAYGPLPDWAPFDPCVAPASNAAPRVVRGGSFRDDAAACDSNARAPALPADKGHAIRLVAFP